MVVGYDLEPPSSQKRTKIILHESRSARSFAGALELWLRANLRRHANRRLLVRECSLVQDHRQPRRRDVVHDPPPDRLPPEPAQGPLLEREAEVRGAGGREVRQLPPHVVRQRPRAPAAPP